MSAERTPQSTPPPASPERPNLVLTEYTPGPSDARRRLADSDRLFALCFIPAIGIVVLACVGLGLADLDHVPHPAGQAKPMRLQWYRPPVSTSLKPKPKPPAHLRPIVTPHPHLTVRPPTRTFTPHVVSHPPTPPRVPTLRRTSMPTPPPTPTPRLPEPVRVPTPAHVLPSPPPTPIPHPAAVHVPRPAHSIRPEPPAISSGHTPIVVHATHTGHGGPAFSTTTTAPVSVPLTGGGSLQPTAPTQFAPEPTPPSRPVETPKPVETPRAVEQPKPRPVEEPKPKPVEQPKPAHYVGSVDSREASVDDGSIQTPDAGDIDASAITGPCVISFEVDESGHLSGVRVKRSCGSPEMDQRCADAIRHGRGVPAVQDHVAYRAKGQYTFSL
jgi:TonB family protein